MNGMYPVRSWRVSALGVEYFEMPKSASNSIHRAITLADMETNHKNIPVNFRFTFVRHPLARLVSAYKEKIQTGKVCYLVSPDVCKELPKTISIDDFVDSLPDFNVRHPNAAISNHWCPQSWIVNSIPNPSLDFVGCLENIAEDWQELTKRGLGPVPHLHETRRELGQPTTITWQQMLTPTTEIKARRFYQDDFDMWPNWWN